MHTENEIHTKPLNIQPKPSVPVLNKGICHPTLLLNGQQLNCPHCTHSLVAQEIPVERRHNYLGMEQDPDTGRMRCRKDDGRFLFYSHVIGVSSMLFDSLLAYTCPFCNTTDVIPGMEAKWDADQLWNEARDREARDVKVGQASLIASPLNHNMPDSGAKSDSEISAEPRACA